MRSLIWKIPKFENDFKLFRINYSGKINLCFFSKPKGPNGFKMLVYYSMTQVTKMPKSLKSQIYFLAILHKKCTVALCMIITFCCLHKKLIIYPNLDQDEEMETFVCKIIRGLDFRPNEFVNYLQFFKDMSNIILSFGFGPVACLRETGIKTV